MKSAIHKPRNPLNMQHLGPEGIYVLPPQLCTKRRMEYFLRENRILGSYAALAIYSDFGRQFSEQKAQERKFNETTPMRLTINGRTMQTTYRKAKEMYQKGIGNLVNYIFLMVYGNFEAYVSDLVCDGLTEQGHLSPIEETIKLLMATKWLGKVDHIAQTFKLKLGKRVRDQKFKDLDMEFAGEFYTDPIEYLQKMADIRHRLIHYSGRVDSLLLEEFPKAGLSVGDLITLPAHLPYDVHFYFVMLTDLIDDAFSKKFGWPRNSIPTERLVE